MAMRIVREPIAAAELVEIAQGQFGDLVKAVVDVRQGIMAIGGELHADMEAALLEDGSAQEDLWGINLYPAKSAEDWIEFDSIINVRPSRGNSSRNVEDPAIQQHIREIVMQLVH